MKRAYCLVDSFLFRYLISASHYTKKGDAPMLRHGQTAVKTNVVRCSFKWQEL